MRIAMAVDPNIPVPPRYYGGIERIVDTLGRGLTAEGHEVTLFSHRASEGPFRLVAYPEMETTGSTLWRHILLIASTVLAGNYDLVHSFGRLAYLLPILPCAIPKLMSYQRGIMVSSVRWGRRLARGTLHFAACSRHLIDRFPGGSDWHLVYNGVPSDRYRFRPQIARDAPLIFLGRVEQIKGPHLAIQVALRTGRSLWLAGNVPPGEKHRAYFTSHIEPHLDGQRIRYLGPVDDARKDKLLGQSCALLMPILWEEPFGIVMAEALACGTPVIGLHRGAVPEVVSHGVNGFMCSKLDDMVASVNRISQIDRHQCRKSMEESFSGEVLVDGYQGVYGKMLGARP